MRRLLPLLLLSLAVAGCGTKLFTHTVTIAVEDPGGRLGTAPVEVSLFDWQMGQSEEWARKSIGVATPAAPFATTITSTATVMAGDTGPRPEWHAGLYVPAIERQGYFALGLTPVDGQTEEVVAPFVPFHDFPADRPRPGPLDVRAAAQAEANGWRLALVLRVPSEPVR